MNKYIAFLLAFLCSSESPAQSLKPAPRLVVNIIIDQLRTDLLERFSPLYKDNGFRRLLGQGCVYESASYPFTPIDKASAVAAINTGASPYMNGIVGERWLDRTTLQPVSCTSGTSLQPSTAALLSSTLADEMKISSRGSAIVWSIAPHETVAILAAGHAADGALWQNRQTGKWQVFSEKKQHSLAWVNLFPSTPVQYADDERHINENVVSTSLQIARQTMMGKDKTCDLLSIFLLATAKQGNTEMETVNATEAVYLELDRQLAQLIDGISATVGPEQALFVVTSTGYSQEKEEDLASYNIPTGTLYINRTANLLNMYLSAIYGQGKYVDACFGNQLYLNHQLIEQRHISINDMLRRAEEFLLTNAGVADVFTSERLVRGNNDVLKRRYGYNPLRSGDITIEARPGWQVLNEETGESSTSRLSAVTFPIIFYGANIENKTHTLPVTTDRIAPTLAKAIHIRAPNACDAPPLF